MLMRGPLKLNSKYNNNFSSLLSHRFNFAYLSKCSPIHNNHFVHHRHISPADIRWFSSVVSWLMWRCLMVSKLTYNDGSWFVCARWLSEMYWLALLIGIAHLLRPSISAQSTMQLNLESKPKSMWWAVKGRLSVYRLAGYQTTWWWRYQWWWWCWCVLIMLTCQSRRI